MVKNHSDSEREDISTNIKLKKNKTEERNIFNDAFNTFYLQIYGVLHMVKDHSDSERGNPLPPLYRQDNTYHGLCYTSRGALAGPRNSSMGPTRGIDPMTHRIMSGRSPTELYLAPPMH